MKWRRRCSHNVNILKDLLVGLDATVSATVIAIILVILVWTIAVLIKHRKDIMTALNQWAKRKQEKDELLKIIYSTKEKVDKYAENRIHDRAQSFEIQKQLTDGINELSEKIDAMGRRQVELEEKHRKRIRAEMKDKISQLYRYYHEKQAWNDMEREAFNDLIDEYEDAGGSNSFVHTVVQPESYTWKVVERT